MPTLILASTSPWRRDMLLRAGLRVRTAAPGVDERRFDCGDPMVLATTLARAKARAVAREHAGAWVLGADQVVWTGTEVQGKPPSPQVHVERLLAMRGRSHQLVTGFCILGPDGVEVVRHDITTLWVRADLEEAEVRAYVQSGEGSGCAGGYAIEGHGAWLFERVEGDWNNILGLPLFAVLSSLRELGWRYGGSHEP